VETLPDSLRQVFDLHWYHGLPLPQVAGLLGVSLKTVKKRWRAARLQLHHVLKDE
jgi:RNA polymerase sigma-70 factor (ECF subfamily)